MALAANVDRDHYVDQELRSFAVAAAAHVFKGGAVGVNAGGYAVPFTPGLVFAGIAYEEADNTDGANGAESVRVYTMGDFVLPVTGAAQGDAGRKVYATDDATFTLSPAGAGFIGSAVHYHATDELVVRIRPGFTESGGHYYGVGEVDCQTGQTPDEVILIPANVNENGLLIWHAVAVVTEVFGGAGEDQGVVTLQDTDGNTLDLTFTASNAGADAVNDAIQEGGGNDTAIQAGNGDALAVVPAGKGVKAKVTQATSGAGAAGKFKIAVDAVPI